MSKDGIVYFTELKEYSLSNGEKRNVPPEVFKIGKTKDIEKRRSKKSYRGRRITGGAEYIWYEVHNRNISESCILDWFKNNYKSFTGSDDSVDEMFYYKNRKNKIDKYDAETDFTAICDVLETIEYRVRLPYYIFDVGTTRFGVLNHISKSDKKSDFLEQIDKSEMNKNEKIVGKLYVEHLFD